MKTQRMTYRNRTGCIGLYLGKIFDDAIRPVDTFCALLYSPYTIRTGIF